MKLLDKAMKEGYVTAKWTKFSVSGAPGTGKSSFLKLLYNELPPEHHDSTSVVATHEVRKVEIISSTMGDNSMWTRIDHKSLTEMIAQGIKDGIRHRELHVDQVKECGQSEGTNVDQTLKKPGDYPTNQQELSHNDDSESSTTAGHDPLITQEIVELLPHVKKSKELYQSHWIYGVDTGGQAAFIDIAPCLLRYHSVNILTHKLTERLNDKAKFFYSIQGKRIREPEKKQITNLELLEALFCSLSSVHSPELPNIKATFVGGTAFVILGTFLDKMHWCGETLRKKNSILGLTLKEYSKVLIKPNPTGEEVIFSLNTTARGTTEENLAKKIRDEMHNYYIEAEIPIRWFLLQLELDKIYRSPKSNCIVSIKKCYDIGDSLGMKKEMVKAALMYYHDITIFLYFPEILPNVVFLHPQPLFDALSNLISISFVDTVSDLHHEGTSLPPGAHDELKEEGTFKENLLTSPNPHLSQGFNHDFTPQDFLKLMTSLFIMASLPEKEKYFLPTVLPTTTCFIKYKSVPHRFKQYTDPLILSWNMKPLPRGVFPALIVNLLSRNHSPKFDLIRPSKSAPRYRNTITLYTDYGDILLVDGINWMAIYSIDHFKGCYALREAIRAGIHKVISNFRYMADLKYFEYFYCNICSYKCSEHFCIVNDDKKEVTCIKSRKTMSLTESRQLLWFSKDGEF